MAQRVHLNGGPWHGRHTTVPANRSHFHIIETTFDKDGNPSDREGMYSAVTYYPGEYEWDGWRSHD